MALEEECRVDEVRRPGSATVWTVVMGPAEAQPPRAKLACPGPRLAL